MTIEFNDSKTFHINKCNRCESRTKKVPYINKLITTIYYVCIRNETHRCKTHFKIVYQSILETMNTCVVIIF